MNSTRFEQHETVLIASRFVAQTRNPFMVGNHKPCEECELTDELSNGLCRYCVAERERENEETLAAIHRQENAMR